MKAIITEGFGGVDVLKIHTVARPELGTNEVLVKVKATAVNRADILQREGKYPPPAGITPVLGLELAGDIAAVGSEVTKWKIGDKVFGLVSGGGYAEYTAIHEDMAMAIPDGYSYEQAAAIPEVYLTAFQSLSWLGKVQKGENVLVHAGASGVGTAAIQLAVQMGANVYVTASKNKHAACLGLGATAAFDRNDPDFWAQIKNTVAKIDVIVDVNGGGYFNENVKLLALDGRLVMLAIMGGIKAPEVNVGHIVFKRLQILGSTLRSRSLDYQIALTKDLAVFATDKWTTRALKPVVDKVFSWNQVGEAHSYMEGNHNVGKVILLID